MRVSLLKSVTLSYGWKSMYSDGSDLEDLQVKRLQWRIYISRVLSMVKTVLSVYFYRLAFRFFNLLLWKSNL